MYCHHCEGLVGRGEGHGVLGGCRVVAMLPPLQLVGTFSAESDFVKTRCFVRAETFCRNVLVPRKFSLGMVLKTWAFWSHLTSVRERVSAVNSCFETIPRNGFVPVQNENAGQNLESYRGTKLSFSDQPARHNQNLKSSRCQAFEL